GSHARRGPSLGGHRCRPGPVPPRRHRAMTTAMGPGPEFDRIRAIAEALGSRGMGIGDDAAVIPDGDGHLVISTDASIEGVHFRRDWLTPEEIGWRAAAGAL